MMKGEHHDFLELWIIGYQICFGFWVKLSSEVNPEDPLIVLLELDLLAYLFFRLTRLDRVMNKEVCLIHA